MQDFEASGISRQSTYEGDEVVSPMHRPSLPHNIHPLVLIGTGGTDCSFAVRIA